MVTQELVAALVEARRRVPRDAWQQVAARLVESEGILDLALFRHFLEGMINRDAAWILFEALKKNSTAKSSEIAAAMTTVDWVSGDKAALTEIIWTGPANNRFPARRIDQVLYDLITVAERRIVLVTFAAHRVHHLCERLTRAVARGVDLTLIVESEEESEGQLTRDAAAAFTNLPQAKIYYWPLQRRERNEAGRPAKLHAKCAIIDDVAVIGSANLTDDAFNRNMELGLLVREQATVAAISEHFSELIRSGVLAQA